MSGLRVEVFKTLKNQRRGVIVVARLTSKNARKLQRIRDASRRTYREIFHFGTRLFQIYPDCFPVTEQQGKVIVNFRMPRPMSHACNDHAWRRGQKRRVLFNDIVDALDEKKSIELLLQQKDRAAIVVEALECLQAAKTEATPSISLFLSTKCPLSRLPSSQKPSTISVRKSRT